MRKRRRQEEREPEQSGKHQLARLDATTRAGVLEQLQRASGNRAMQAVVAGAQLQRDTATTTKPAAGSTRQAGAAEWLLSLDGTVVGSVAAVEGGSIRADVIEQTGTGHKHIGQVQHEPFVLKVGSGLGKDFYDWIAQILDHKHSRRDLVLHQVDPGSRQELTRLELKECLLNGVEVPQLDAAQKSPAWLKVTIAPEQVQRRQGSNVKVGAKSTSDPLDPSTMRFEVSGIGSVEGLTSIAPWGFTQATAKSPRGDLEGIKLDVGNLLVTLADGSKGSAAFDDWVDKSMVKGEIGKNERTAVLTVSSKGGRKLELSFSGVEIFSAERVARAGAGGRRYGLFVERAAFRVS